MKIALSVAFMLLLASATPVYAEDAAALAKAKNCFACHGTQTEGIGPSFTDIARRFSGLKNAKSMLASVIEVGSDSPTAIYHWSHLKMPPAAVRVPVSKAEAGVLADYVLSFK